MKTEWELELLNQHSAAHSQVIALGILRYVPSSESTGLGKEHAGLVRSCTTQRSWHSGVLLSALIPARL